MKTKYFLTNRSLQWAPNPLRFFYHKIYTSGILINVLKKGDLELAKIQKMSKQRYRDIANCMIFVHHRWFTKIINSD